MIDRESNTYDAEFHFNCSDIRIRPQLSLSQKKLLHLGVTHDNSAVQ